jgi:hypothetical protein
MRVRLVSAVPRLILPRSRVFKSSYPWDLNAVVKE